MMPKDTKTCDQEAMFRYTWPGRDEALICGECSVGLVRIAHAVGLYLQLIPVSSDVGTCAQNRSVAA